MALTEEVRERVGMSLEDFNEAQAEQPFELLDGERFDRMPNPIIHSWYIRLFFVAMYNHAIKYQLGEVFTETTYAQFEGKAWVKGSRIPDVLYFSRERFEALQAIGENWFKMPMSLAPDLVVEILSASERAVHVAKKLQVDKRNGVRLVWVVDPENQQVTVYHGEQIRVLSAEDVLEGYDILPEFRLALKDVFKP